MAPGWEAFEQDEEGGCLTQRRLVRHPRQCHQSVHQQLVYHVHRKTSCLLLQSIPVLEPPLSHFTFQSLTGFKLSVRDLSLSHFIRVGILRRNVILCQMLPGRGHCCHLESIRGGAEVANVRGSSSLQSPSARDRTTSATASNHLNLVYVKKCFAAAVNHHQSSALKRSPS